MRGRLLITLFAAAMALGASAASAVATTDRPVITSQQRGTVQPDFTCPDRTICLFPNNDFSGNYSGGSPVVLATDEFNGAWMTFASVGASGPNPGSLNDKSGSIMWIFSKDLNNAQCLTPGKWILQHSSGWFFIEFGVSTCPNPGPALASPSS